MNNIIRDIKKIDEILRELNRINNKLEDGKIIPAYRDLNRLRAFFEQYRMSLIEEQAGETPNPVQLPNGDNYEK